MKYLAALLLLIRRLLDRWDAIEKEARDEAAQEDRDRLQQDPGGWFDDRFSNGVQRRPHDASQTNDTDKPGQS